MEQILQCHINYTTSASLIERTCYNAWLFQSVILTSDSLNCTSVTLIINYNCTGATPSKRIRLKLTYLYNKLPLMYKLFYIEKFSY